MQLLSMEHTMCPDYRPADISALIVKIVRGPLTKHIGSILGDVVDEMSCAVEDKLHMVTSDGETS